MLGTPRISLGALAGLCRRLATAHSSGIDLRKSLNNEAGRARGPLGQNLRTVCNAVAAGDGLADAVEQTGEFFPPLFREMTSVGEQTGSLAEVLQRLADYYQYQVQLRRQFLAGMTWPLIQLVAAVVIVGLLIWITGLIGDLTGGAPVDLLGLGLVGTRGLLVYLLLVGLTAGGLAALARAVRRGSFRTAGLERALIRLPVVGQTLQTMALARLAWSLELTLNVDMDLRRVVPLALRSTGRDYYVQHGDAMVSDIASGRELHEAFRHAELFPDEFLAAVEVAEHSGQLPSTMAHLSRQYEEKARAALAALSIATGMAVWALVALLIIMIIFRLAMFYLGVINDALNF